MPDAGTNEAENIITLKSVSKPDTSPFRFKSLGYLGSGASIETFKGKILSENPLDDKFLALKRIKRKPGEDYEKTFEQYKKNLEPFMEAFNLDNRHVCSVLDVCTNADKDGAEQSYYILQDLATGPTYKDQKFEDGDLESELIICREILKLIDRFLCHGIKTFDLKLDNFILHEPENGEPDKDKHYIVVYFDLDSYSTLSGGRLTRNGEFRDYLYNCEDDESIVTACALLMLYQHLYSELPAKKEHPVFHNFTGYDFKQYPCIRYGMKSEIADRLSDIFRKGIQENSYRHITDARSEIQALIDELRKSGDKRLSERMNLPSLTEEILGREDECEKIDKLFENRGCKQVYLYGMAGIGKTHTAIKYAHTQEQLQEKFSHCFMVSFAESIKKTVVEKLLFTNYDGEDKLRECSSYDEEIGEAKRYNDIYKKKMEYLRFYSEDTLLIIDNLYDSHKTLKDIQAEKEFLEFCGMPFRILFTTRYEVDYSGIYIGELPDHDLTSLFIRERRNTNISSEIITNIVNAVYKHTLLVSIVARILRTGTLTEEEILYILQQNNGLDSNQLPEFQKPVSYLTSEESDRNYRVGELLKTLFNISVLTDAEKKILYLLSLTRGENVCLKTFCNLLDSGNEAIGVCRHLAEMGWIQIENDSISLHDLVSEIISLNHSESLTEIRTIIENWLVYRYDSTGNEEYYDAGITSIIKSIVREYLNWHIKFPQFFNRFITDVQDNAYILAAYETGDIFSAKKIAAMLYGTTAKPVIFIIGSGTQTGNYYIITHNGEETINCSEIHRRDNISWRGKIVWCWEPEQLEDASDIFLSTCFVKGETEEPDWFELIEIAEAAFKGTKSISVFKITAGTNLATRKPVYLQRIGKSAFMYSDILSFWCDGKFEEIEENTFFHCKNLFQVLFCFANIKNYDDRAFYACSNLERVVSFSDGHISVGAYAFAGCDKLTGFINIASEDSNELALDMIGEYSFYYCKALKSKLITIHASSVGDHSFEACINISSIELAKEVKTIGYHAFCGCENLDIISPLHEMEIKYDAFRGCSRKVLEMTGCTDHFSVDWDDISKERYHHIPYREVSDPIGLMFYNHRVNKRIKKL